MPCTTWPTNQSRDAFAVTPGRTPKGVCSPQVRQGGTAFLEPFDVLSAHFELRCAPDSTAIAGADAILRRLESAWGRLVEALDLGTNGAGAGRVPVYLLETAANGAGRPAVVHVNGVSSILATYQVDAPAVGLERAVAEYLLGRGAPVHAEFI